MRGCSMDAAGVGQCASKMGTEQDALRHETRRAERREFPHVLRHGTVPVSTRRSGDAKTGMQSSWSFRSRQGAGQVEGGKMRGRAPAFFRSLAAPIPQQKYVRAPRAARRESDSAPGDKHSVGRCAAPSGAVARHLPQRTNAHAACRSHIRPPWLQFRPASTALAASDVS